MAEQDPGGNPPDKRPPAYNGPFLFVNKNATNLKSKQREEVFAVRSHAMQIARRSRKPSSQAQSKSQEREKRTQAEAQSPESPPVQDTVGSPAAEALPSVQGILEQQAMGVRQYQQRQQSNSSRRQAMPHQPPRRRLSLALPGGPTPGPAPSSGLLPIDHAAALAQLTISASPSSMSPGGPGPSGLPSDSFFNSVLHFWRLAYMSNFWPAHIYLNTSHKAVHFTDGWLRDMVINNPAMLHGLFAGALSYITNYLPPTENTPMLWARAIHHYGKCLEETRVELARPGIGTEQALSLVHGMTTFSFHCQDLESCQVHRTASMRLLQNLEGGLESVHPVLKYLLILVDSLIAGHVPKRPSIDLDSWSPKPWAEDVSLRPFDSMFGFDPQLSCRTDMTVFLLYSDPKMDDYSDDLLELINWHREALVANELAFNLTHTSPAGSPGITESGIGEVRDRADPIYTWLSLRQYTLSCLTSGMFADLLEDDNHEPSLSSQLHRTYHACVALATSYLFQFVMRRDMDAPCMAYIPYHHLRTQLELLLALMSQFRRTSISSATPGGPGRGAVNPIPTDGLLFLFFAGALGEEYDGPSRVRTAHSIARAGVIASPTLEHPSDLINERWFSVHFSMILQRLNVDTWENARSILKRFVYQERVLDHYLQFIVARKLEFLAALVGGVPGQVTPGGTGFFGGLGASSSSRPPGPSRRSSSQIPIQSAPIPRQQSMDMPMSMPMTLPGATSLLSPGQTYEGLPGFGHSAVSLSEAVPATAADWWQDIGYGYGGEEDFSMDLDMHLSMDALPDLHMPGEDLGEHEEDHEE
ncbi:hypothetical protein H2200_004498 [Cladophialophora chaetospira]|uniref:Transcription factor domain-containing protein n=1 Tax=Cladophialophora chaetospira TaxID=386627 RepID=A0AA39CKH9_9EURO|nr:hypothetical protein H2200_004498 [Cladophialophora chaetospira]